MPEQDAAQQDASEAVALTPGDEVGVRLPWVEAEQRFSFDHTEAGPPHTAGEGVGGDDSVNAWPQDYAGTIAVVFELNGGERGAQRSFPVEAVVPYSEMRPGTRTTRSGGTAVVCGVVDCGNTKQGGTSAESAEQAGLSVVPTARGRVPLCRRHRKQVREEVGA